MVLFRSLLLLSTMLLACHTLRAQQEPEKKKIEETDDEWNGIRLGCHMARLSGEEEGDARIGFYEGYYRNLLNVPLYSLSLGLEYHTAGGEIGAYEQRLNYISLPLNNRFKLGPAYADLGVEMAILVIEKWRQDHSEIDIPDGYEAERTDLLLHAGVGCRVVANLSVMVRYRMGLMDVYEGYRNIGWEFGVCSHF